MTSDLKIQLHVDTSIPLPQAAFVLVGTVRLTKRAKPDSLYLLIDPEHIRSVEFEANTNPPTPFMHSLPSRRSLSLCFNMTRPPTLVGPQITPLVPKGERFRILFDHMTALSAVDKITIYFDPASIGAEVQDQFAFIPSLFSSNSNFARPARSDTHYNLRRLYCGEGGQPIQSHTTLGLLSSTTPQDQALPCSPTVDDRGLELAGGYPDNDLDPLQGFASASAPGLPNDTCPASPSNEGLVSASSRSTSPDLDCHVNKPNMQAIVTWEHHDGQLRHTLDFMFGFHIDTSKRTALFSLHRHYSGRPRPRPNQIPMGLLIHPEDIEDISVSRNDAESHGVVLPRSIYRPNGVDKVFRLDLKLNRPPRYLWATHERLEDASPILQELFLSLRHVYRLSIYFFTQEMDFFHRIRFLPSAVLPTEPRFRPKAPPDIPSFLSEFFGSDCPSSPLRLPSVSPDSSSGYETDSSSGYETAQEELPPPNTTTTQKRRRSWDCCALSSDVKRKMRRLESRIRDLEKKKETTLNFFEARLNYMNDLWDSRWMERFGKRYPEY